MGGTSQDVADGREIQGIPDWRTVSAAVIQADNPGLPTSLQRLQARVSMLLVESGDCP
ncbi:hypothetical protein BOO71_0013492 [Deinococcus marmoris]|uniref:Uncharacterized protein n=1 Tax=Deinococcus marmoris TaxID=249408 RepID=A0A1U7NSL2_9DEIO|nr:hypothetical protein BOO71_0013492 [Deinococcus marmoris]